MRLFIWHFSSCTVLVYISRIELHSFVLLLMIFVLCVSRLKGRPSECTRARPRLDYHRIHIWAVVGVHVLYMYGTSTIIIEVPYGFGQIDGPKLIEGKCWKQEICSWWVLRYRIISPYQLSARYDVYTMSSSNFLIHAEASIKSSGKLFSTVVLSSWQQHR